MKFAASIRVIVALMQRGTRRYRERPCNKPSSHIERPISYNKVRTTSWGTMRERFWKRCTPWRLASSDDVDGAFGRNARGMDAQGARSISPFIIYGRQTAYAARQYSRRDGVYATSTARTFGSGYLERSALH